MDSQSEKSPTSFKEEIRCAPPETTSQTGPLTAADYVYRIAAVTVGIILLATVV